LISKFKLLVAVSIFYVLGVKAQVPHFYEIVAKEKNVPSELFFAIALQESGKNFKGKRIPWPWTLNICGKGVYFDSKEEAVHFLGLAIEAECSVDVGLMQIHWQTHHKKFKSYSQALEPIINMRAGATILLNQYKRSGDWYIATGRYHSPNNKRLAENYRKKVLTIYNKEFQ
jgi:soluble lytic murein transglycosylase-like protein